MISMARCGAPRFVQLFSGRLNDWAEYLMDSPGTIVAISRKGPRLLEVLVREGLLPPGFMQRVVTERSLPFLNESHLPLVITDDHVCWGSTFGRIYRLAQQSAKMWSKFAEVIGVPFAVSKDASGKVLPTISKFFLSLRSDDVAPFVNNETNAFRLLGKPYDIEHPMLTISGDFEDIFKTEAILQNVASLVHGKLIRVFPTVATSDGPLEVKAWSILVDACAKGQANAPDLCKLRAYLTPERDRLVIAAMYPKALRQSSLQPKAKLFCSSLDQLWYKMVEMVPTKSEGRLQKTVNRSLAMWANFLNAMPLLLFAKRSFEETLDASIEDFEFFGPAEDDLRFLVGPSLAGYMQSSLASFLSEPQQVELFAKPADVCGTLRAPDEWIPDGYVEAYRQELSRQLSKADDVDLVLQALFYAQHRVLELPSRRDDLDGEDRLEFGITFNKIREEVHKFVPDADEADIHRCFDRLIDEGCIVPRYSDFGQDPDPIWMRTFRVGEGPLEKMLQTVRLLFESLAGKIGGPTLPRLLFEKFCVLALSVASDHRRLSALKELHTSKGFHLYGARMEISTGKEQRFLLDWAVEQGILSRPNLTNEQDEASTEYVLNDLEDVYPRRECPWDDEVKDAIDDLAKIAATIHNTKGLKGNALVLVTSLASDQEFHKAAEAELDLWLHDRNFSIAHAMQAMGRIARKARIEDLTKEDLDAANNIIWHTANFSVQVAKKKKLVGERQKLYNEIGALVAGDTLMSRVWRDVNRTLESRIISEATSSGLTQILSALRIAHVTNSLLRNLLSYAGYRDPYGRPTKSIEESLDTILRTLRDRDLVDEVAKSAFFIRGGVLDICELIENVRSSLPPEFCEVFEAVRPIVSGIIECCEQILRDYGSADFRETPQTLEPPKYIMMWDVRRSSEVEAREREIDPLIESANQRIDNTLRGRVRGFKPESRDDGNGLVCSSFPDVIVIYRILDGVFRDIHFRAGVEVNVQGRLNYYPRSKALGGRAFEHAARICSMFKELETSPGRWHGDDVPIEPEGNYLIIGEFAHRYAEKEGAWNFDGWTIVEPPGEYEPRVRASLPISVTIVKGTR